MKLWRVDPQHRHNARDDGYCDFETLKHQGLVRDKRGNVISIEKAINRWSAIERDSLYQSFCEMMKSNPSADDVDKWIRDAAAKLGMSERRAVDIINEGNGQWPGANMRWWRGVSLT